MLGRSGRRARGTACSRRRPWRRGRRPSGRRRTGISRHRDRAGAGRPAAPGDGAAVAVAEGRCSSIAPAIELVSSGSYEEVGVLVSNFGESVVGVVGRRSEAYPFSVISPS